MLAGRGSGQGLPRAGVNADRVLEHDTKVMQAPTVLPDIIAYLQKETELTRHTLVTILKGSGRVGDFRINPQQFIAVHSHGRTRQGERFSPTGFSLTGANSENGINVVRSVRRAAKRKTLRVITC